MTQIDDLGVHKRGNSSTLKTSASGSFLKEQREQRVVSLQFLNESFQTADPPKCPRLRVVSYCNIFGSR